MFTLIVSFIVISYFHSVSIQVCPDMSRRMAEVFSDWLLPTRGVFEDVGKKDSVQSSFTLTVKRGELQLTMLQKRYGTYY